MMPFENYLLYLVDFFRESTKHIAIKYPTLFFN